MIHIHLHTNEVYNDKIDALYQCRCGHLKHRELNNSYNEDRTAQQTKLIGEQLIKRYETNNTQITYRSGIRR